MCDPSASRPRLCSRQTCRRAAETTLTYVYADSTAVVGPLSVHREPHAYDLCSFHAARLTPPRGWNVLHLDGAGAQATFPQHDERQDEPEGGDQDEDPDPAGPRSSDDAAAPPADASSDRGARFGRPALRLVPPMEAALREPERSEPGPQASPAQLPEALPEPPGPEQDDHGPDADLLEEIFQGAPFEDRARPLLSSQPHGMRRPHLRRPPQR